jgi:hypothetical protein
MPWPAACAFLVAVALAMNLVAEEDSGWQFALPKAVGLVQFTTTQNVTGAVPVRLEAGMAGR